MKWSTLLLLAVAVSCAVAAKHGETLYESSFKPSNLQEGSNNLVVTEVNQLDDLYTPKMVLEVAGEAAQSITLKFAIRKNELKSISGIRLIVSDPEAPASAKPIFKSDWDASLEIVDVAFGFRERLADLPTTVSVRVVQLESHRTRFVYVLKGMTRMPKNRYDLTPWNTSMGVYFTLGYNGFNQNGNQPPLEWWIKRRPPVPPITATLHHNEKLVLSHYIPEVKSGGIGFSNVMTDGVEKSNTDIYTFAVTFSEFHRDFHARTKVDGLYDLLKGMETEGDLATREYDTDIDGLKVKLVYYASSKSVGLHVIQPYPMRDVQVYMHDTKGHRVFLEETTHVPFAKPDAPLKNQFGWAHVIPTKHIKHRDIKLRKKPKKNEYELEDDDPDNRIKGDAVTIHVYYNKREHYSAWDLLTDWMQDYEANIHTMVLKKHEEGGYGVFSKFALVESQYIAVVPFRLLLSHTITQHENWCKKVAKSTQWQDHIVKHGLDDASETGLMQLTLFLLMQAHSPYDGTSWKVYFETFPKAAPHTPLFWTEEELNVFAFYPKLKEDMMKMKKVINEEYALICKKLPWFGKIHSFSDYIRTRGHIMSRAFEIGDNHILTPAYDFISHSDEPNAAIVFDQDNGTMPLQAKRDIEEGEEITVDYMALGTKYKYNFLVRFGFIPEGAQDVAEIDGRVLTTKKESRKHFLPNDDENETTKEELQEFIRVIDGQLGDLGLGATQNVAEDKVELAKTLVESHKTVLNKHKKWAQEDLLNL